MIKIMSLSTLFGLGNITLKGQGTIASAAAAIACYLCSSWSLKLKFIAFIIILIMAFISVNYYLLNYYPKYFAQDLEGLVEVGKTRPDPKEVVIDEFLGQSLAIYLPSTVYCNDHLNLILSFILFRIFDIFKPFPVNYIEDSPYIRPYMAIILDDIAAALLTIIVKMSILNIWDAFLNTSYSLNLFRFG